MPTLSLAYGDIFYVSTVVPEVQPETRPVVLCLHGAGGSFQNFHYFFKDMGKTWPIVVPDLPGHGKSAPLPGTVTIPAYADFVEAFWDALCDEWGRRPPLILLGHSMGGAIAIEYTLTRQDMAAAPSGLVIVAASGRMRVRPDFLASLAEGRFHPDLLRAIAAGNEPVQTQDEGAGVSNNGLARQRARIEAKEAIEAQGAHDVQAGGKPSGSTVARSAPPRPRAVGVGAAPEVAYRDLLACDGFDRLADLPSIRVPTLLIHGAEDAMTPAKYVQAAAAAIPGARIVTIPRTGHLVHHHKVDAFRRNVKVFARELESSMGKARSGR